MGIFLNVGMVTVIAIVIYFVINVSPLVLELTFLTLFYFLFLKTVIIFSFFIYSRDVNALSFSYCFKNQGKL